MPRRKKERGRPSKPYPPRIDATPEEALHRMFNTPPSTAIEEREYRCSDCGREVYYPTFYTAIIGAQSATPPPHLGGFCLLCDIIPIPNP